MAHAVSCTFQHDELQIEDGEIAVLETETCIKGSLEAECSTDGMQAAIMASTY